MRGCWLTASAHTPDALLAPDHAVRGDVGVARHAADLRAGARVERAQQLHGASRLRSAPQPQFCGQARDADLRQALERARRDALGQCLARRVVAATARAAGAGIRPACARPRRPGRSAGSGAARRGSRLRRRSISGCSALGDRIERFAQVAVVVDGFDQRRADAAVARRQVGQVQLPQTGGPAGCRPRRRGRPRRSRRRRCRAGAAAARARSSTRPRRIPLGRAIGGIRAVVVVGVLAFAFAFGRQAFVVGRRLDLLGLGPVQQRIAFHRRGDLGLQFERRQLQQADAPAAIAASSPGVVRAMSGGGASLHP